MKPRTEISMQLYNLMMERGYPENLCDLVTRNLNTDYTATRMIVFDFIVFRMVYTTKLSGKSFTSYSIEQKINDVYY